MRSQLRKAEDVAPNPGDLVESLRDFGYTLPSALADLIDNSLTAGADHIRVTIESRGHDSHIAVVDNGSGMDKKTLIEAMRMGTHGPGATRAAEDLGRFGLGMKTASLSQGRRLTVITKTQDKSRPLVRRWDIGHIQKTRRWQLLEGVTSVGEPFLSQVQEMKSGTAVVIEDLDRTTFLKVGPSQVQEHLGRAADTRAG